MTDKYIIDLDRDVYEIVPRISRRSGETPGKALSRLVRRGLSGRFPAFPVPGDALPISLVDLQRVIDEEGLI